MGINANNLCPTCKRFPLVNKKCTGDKENICDQLPSRCRCTNEEQVDQLYRET